MSAITETTIANRALQHLGATRIPAGQTFRQPQSKNAAAIQACYDTLRRAELRRNVWRFSIRVNALRAVDLDTMLVTWAAWSSVTTYALNDIVVGSDNQRYISLVANNLNNDPTLTIGSGFWALYTGTDTASQYVTTWNSSYNYSTNQSATGSNGTTYISLVSNNLNNDPTVVPAAWNSGTTYALGKFVTYNGAVYQSLINGNLNNQPNMSPTDWLLLVANSSGQVGWGISTSPNVGTTYYAGELVYTLTSPAVVYISTVNNNSLNPIGDTTGSWQQFTTAPTITLLLFIYPIGAGPGSETYNRNAYRLPAGYLRQAPKAPKAGVNAFLGAPAGVYFDDWEFQDNYLTTFDPGPIVFRFAADISDPGQMDPMFVEGFAGRLGAETCEEITQSDEKISKCEAIYAKFMGEARTVNGIETGSVEPPIDEYISVRY